MRYEQEVDMRNFIIPAVLLWAIIEMICYFLPGYFESIAILGLCMIYAYDFLKEYPRKCQWCNQPVHGKAIIFANMIFHPECYEFTEEEL